MKKGNLGKIKKVEEKKERERMGPAATISGSVGGNHLRCSCWFQPREEASGRARFDHGDSVIEATMEDLR